MKPISPDAKHIISIIIPTTGNTERLQPCLESIRKQNIASPEIEVLIGLNQSTDRKLALDLLENEKVILSSAGVNRARNACAETAKGKYLYFLDDDCQLIDTNLLEALREYIESHPSISGVGGPYTLPSHTTFSERLYNKIAANWIRSQTYAPHSTLYLLGGNMFIRSEAFNDKLRFDEDVLWGGAELSYFLSAAKARLTFHWQNQFSVLHSSPLSLPQLYKKIRKQQKTSILYRQKGLVFRRCDSDSDKNLSNSERLVLKSIEFVQGPYWQIMLRATLLPLYLLAQFYPRQLMRKVN